MSELDRLIRFAAVAEELSFSQAARRLHVDQPWLSRQIQQLESRLGFALLIRSTRRISLTPEGERLFESARKLADIAEECEQITRDMMREHGMELVIGVNPYTYWVPERKKIIDAFTVRDDRVSVEIVANYTARLISKLRKRIIDVALCPEIESQPDLETMIIHASPVSLLVPPEDPLAKHKSVPVTALAGREIPVIHKRLNPAHWNVRYKPFVDAGAKPLVIPEGEPAIPYVARERRLPVVAVGWPHNEPASIGEFVHVAISEPVPMVRYMLVRRKEAPRALLNHFWNSSAKVAGQEV